METEDLKKCTHPGCRSWRCKNDIFCVVHSQKKATIEKMKLGRFKGGMTKKKLLEIEHREYRNSQDIRELLSECLNELRAVPGDIIQKNRSIAYISQIFLSNLIQADIEERLTAIETELNKPK